MRYLSFCVIFFLLLTHFLCSAEVRLPKIFSSHAVLQRDMPIPVWGWAEKGEKITVIFNQRQQKVTADKNGKWRVIFPAMPAGGAYTLSVKGANQITLTDIWIGEVWICSGQSNMEWTVKDVKNADLEIQNANFPKIRHFKVGKAGSITPQEEVESGSWEICNPQTISEFTAVGYFFAHQLLQDLNVPIGLINTSWGGTCAETWTSAESLQIHEDYKHLIPSSKMDWAGYLKKENEKVAFVQQIIDKEGFPSTSEESLFYKVDLEDKHWRTTKLPDRDDQNLFTVLNGTIWYRKQINLPTNFSTKDVLISLCEVLDQEVVYINDTNIEKVWSEYPNKVYQVPDDVLHTGVNTIAIRLTDWWSEGGFLGEEQNFHLRNNTQTISLAGDWKYKIVNKTFLIPPPDPNRFPSVLFNAMIYPLIPYAIKGAIWYQGESNVEWAAQYKELFPMMISDWRKQWAKYNASQSDFPFLFVQLANYGEQIEQSNNSNWAELREAQSYTLNLPHTGMAVTIDIGEAKDIHPRNKQDVGKRLAMNALKNVYHKNIVGESPIYESMQINGNKVVISFKNKGSGLIAKDKHGYLKNFAVAGADKKFYWAKAWIENDKVVVFSEQVPLPIAVRYAWDNCPSEANLYNKEGFPASPFRTDDWSLITENRKYK